MTVRTSRKGCFGIKKRVKWFNIEKYQVRDKRGKIQKRTRCVGFYRYLKREYEKKEKLNFEKVVFD